MIVKGISGLSDRRIWIPLLVLSAIVFALSMAKCSDGEENKSRPPLMLMSSIPLQWGNASMAQIASGKAEASPLYESLASKNKLTILDDVQRLGQPGKAPLLLVQPRALAPAELVALDAWVRKGGAVIIFADPVLDWPIDLPLGDQRRPLFTSLLNPLFRHWGVELALPVAQEGVDVTISAGEYGLSLKSPGIWLKPKKGNATGRCRIRSDEHIAVCSVGKGKAILIADADVLHESQWTGGLLTSGTMVWLQELIAAARTSKAFPNSLWENQGN